MTMRIIAVLLGLVALQSALCAQQCPWGSNPVPTQILSYLKQHAPSEQNPCIDEAFSLLKPEDVPDSAIPLIVSFLDHKRELNGAEQQGFVLHPKVYDYMYPATDLLFRLKKRAVPALVSVLATSTDETAQRGAFNTWQLIFRDDPPAGVRELLRRAGESQEPMSAARLQQVASKFAHSCLPDQRQQCTQALNQTQSGPKLP